MGDNRFAFQTKRGNPSEGWLEVDWLLPFDDAMAIMQLIREDDMARSGAALARSGGEQPSEPQG